MLLFKDEFFLPILILLLYQYFLLIFSQNIISDALSNNELDLFKKTNLALKYFRLIKGKDDKAKKSEYKLFKYSKLGSF